MVEFLRLFLHVLAAPLLDIPGEYVTVSGLPTPPTGAAIRRIDVIIRGDRNPAPGRRLEVF
jgi:hypothetical protein